MHRRCPFLFIALVISLLAWPALHAHAFIRAGTLTGKLDVGQMGSADYRIPIEIPPGTAGVQPSLSLMYSSNGMDGLLGVGWAVSGLSTITRCPTTLAQDNRVDPINFDGTSSNDR